MPAGNSDDGMVGDISGPAVQQSNTPKGADQMERLDPRLITDSTIPAEERRVLHRLPAAEALPPSTTSAALSTSTKTNVTTKNRRLDREDMELLKLAFELALGTAGSLREGEQSVGLSYICVNEVGVGERETLLVESESRAKLESLLEKLLR